MLNKDKLLEKIKKEIHQEKDYYLYDDVNKIVDNVFSHLFYHQMASSNNDNARSFISNRSNILINGPKGVGKTKIMEICYKYTKLHFDKCIPIFINFEENYDFNTDIMNIFENQVKEKNNNYKNLNNYTGLNIKQSIKESGYYILLLIDEIQKLYDFDNDNNKNKAIKIMKTILSIAKSEYALVIASGSSSDLESKAFKKDEYAKLYSEFPNLNDSVFKFNRIEPIRNENIITNFINKIYGRIEYNTNDLFLYTGGIPGEIKDYIPIKNITDKTIPFDMFNIKNEMDSNNHVFMSICHYLYFKNIDILNNNIYKLKGISNDTLTNIFSRHKIERMIKLVYYYRDKGYLLQNKQGECYPLYPVLINMLHNYFKDDITNLQLASLEGTFMGWENTYTPGHLNEELITKCFFKNQDFINIEIGGSFTYKINKKYNLSEIFNHLDEFIKLDNEIGTDGIIIRKNDNDFDIYIIQIKTGKIGTSILLGTEKSTDTSRYFYKMLLNAQKQYNIIKNTYKDYNIKFKKYILITNKNLNKDVITYITDRKKVELKKLKLDDTVVQIDKNVEIDILKWDDLKVLLGDNIINKLGLK